MIPLSRDVVLFLDSLTDASFSTAKIDRDGNETLTDTEVAAKIAFLRNY